MIGHTIRAFCLYPKYHFYSSAPSLLSGRVPLLDPNPNPGIPLYSPLRPLASTLVSKQGRGLGQCEGRGLGLAFTLGLG